MKLILLGTGAVRPDLEHWGPAQVVEAAGEYLLFDCGRGATMRMVQAKIPYERIRRTFFTHHHIDHKCAFAYFFLCGWLMGRDVPLEVIGPRGTETFCDGLLKQAYRADLDSRRHHPMYSRRGVEYTARDVLEDELTLEGEGYSVRMVHVLHKPHILDNLAFRIEAEGRSLVVVGDTVVSESLMDLAEGADLMVHECSFPTEVLEREKWGAFHTSPRDLGRWAKERGVKRLVLKHYCLRPGVVELEPMIEEVREEFGSEGLIAGRDLMEIEV